MAKFERSFKIIDVDGKQLYCYAVVEKKIICPACKHTMTILYNGTYNPQTLKCTRCKFKTEVFDSDMQEFYAS
jgi:transposase-like protein